MQPPIPIKVTKKDQPDLERFAAALLAVAVTRLEAEEHDRTEDAAEADRD